MFRFVLLLSFLSSSVLAAAPKRATHPLLLDGAVLGADIIAVGERGTILRSSDSGENWTALASPSSATLTGIAFAPDGRTGWAVGHDAFIAVSTDGGVSWQKQWQGKNLEASFLDVGVIDARRAIAIGAYGLCMTTADAGKTWTVKKILEEDMHLNRITRGPTGTLYIAGEHGTLLRSRDEGETWQRIDSPYDGSFYGILPLDERTLLAYGLRGRVFRSTDDGESWQPIAIDRPLLLTTALKLKSGSLFLAGQARALYVSRDGGLTFNHWQISLNSAIAELLEAPDGDIVALGDGGAARIRPPSADAARPDSPPSP